MNSTITSWSFGFGGWIGILGGLFLFMTVPHNYPILTLLLSPWLGGVGMYLLMYVTHAWINVTVQITQAMIQHDVIIALLSSIIGVLIVAIVRQIIDMERGPRTPAEVAAVEPAEDTQHGPPSPTASDGYQSGNEADDESGAVLESESEDEHEDRHENEETEEDTSGEEEEDEGEEGDDEDDEDDGEEGDDEDDGEEGDDEEEGDDGEEGDDEDEGEEGDDEEGDEEEEGEESTHPLNQAALIQNSEESSFENIQTPQLTAIQPTASSPIPQIDDV